MTAVDYFYEHLHDATDECMIWPHGVYTSGYGRVKLKGKFYGVAALACAEQNGPRPTPTHEAAHGPCHNRLCWNGRHLTWKTHSENAADRLRDGTTAQGEGNPGAKLTEADVREIRERVANGERRAVMQLEFGISSAHVTSIVNRKSWKHVA